MYVLNYIGIGIVSCFNICTDEIKFLLCFRRLLILSERFQVNLDFGLDESMSVFLKPNKKNLDIQSIKIYCHVTRKRLSKL